jgi:hypothetical protein
MNLCALCRIIVLEDQLSVSEAKRRVERVAADDWQEKAVALFQDWDRLREKVKEATALLREDRQYWIAKEVADELDCAALEGGDDESIL